MIRSTRLAQVVMAAVRLRAKEGIPFKRALREVAAMRDCSACDARGDADCEVCAGSGLE